MDSMRSGRQESSVFKTNARSRFGGYHKEKRTDARKADVREDNMLRELVRIFLDRSNLGVGFGTYASISEFANYYARVCRILEEREIGCSANDVRKFSIVMPGLHQTDSFSSKAGMFLSALVNTGNDEDYEMDVNLFDKPLNYLGFQNTKSIKINGNAGEYLGYNMKSGNIEVTGNVETCAGTNMINGTIIIHGNVGCWAGHGLKCGLLIIKGDADAYLGGSMKGGKIIVEKNAGMYLGCRVIDAVEMEYYPIEGGEIEIRGNVGWGACTRMKGGKVTILGDVSYSLANGMEGGEIIVYGNVKSLGKILGGNVSMGGDIEKI